MPSNDASVVTIGSSALLASQLVSRTAAVALLVVATRALSPEQYGVLAIAATFYSIATLLADFGTSRVLTRDVARGADPNDLLSSTAALAVALGALAGVGTAGLGVVLYSGQTTFVLFLVGLGMPAHALLTSVLGAMDGLGRVPLRSVISLALNLGISLGGAAAIATVDDATAGVVPMAGAPWLLLVATLPVCRRIGLWRPRLVLDRGASSRFLRAALPFAALSGVATLYTRFDLLLLSTIRGTSDVAEYDVAVRIVEGLSFPAAVIAGTSIIVVARRLGSNDQAGAQRALSRISWVAGTVGVVLGGLLAGVADPLTRLLAGEDFASSVPLVRILAIQVVLHFFAAVQGAVMSAGHTMRRTVSIGAGLLLGVVLADLLAIPLFGTAGAAWTTVAAQIVNVYAYAKRNEVELQLRTPMPRIGTLVGGLVAFGTAAMLEGSLGLFAVAPATMASGTALLVTGGLTATDLREVRSLVTNARG